MLPTLYSHLHGVEYLLVRKPAILAEVERLINRHLIRQGVGQEIRPIIRILRQSARKLGWRNGRLGLEKDGVALAFHLPSSAKSNSFEERMIKRVLDYSSGKIDVGIEVLPIRKTLTRVLSGTDTPVPNFETEVANIIEGGRISPRAPLVLIGISL